jgi:hypothetical protein
MLKWWRQFRCDTLDWHTSCGIGECDGASFISRCAYCNRRILMDSNGDWFATWKRADGD